MLIAILIAAMIAIAAAYVLAPYAFKTSTSGSSSTTTTSANVEAYLNEYGNADNWAWSPDTGIPSSNASVLAEAAFNTYPVQTSPFLAGGGSLQVGLSGYSYIGNIGNYELYGMNIETQNEIYDVAIPNSPITPYPYLTPFFHIQATTSIGTLPEVWLSTPWAGIYGFQYVDATNANYGWNMTVPGSPQDLAGPSEGYSRAAPNFIIDQTRDIMVAGPEVNATGTPGRGFVEGWKIGSPTNVTLEFGQTVVNVTSATNVWTDWLSPPQNGGSGAGASWDQQEIASIPYVWEFNGTGAVNLHTLPSSTLSSIISDDWAATPSSAVFSTGAESNSSWIADSSNGMTYIVTSPPETVSLSSSFTGPALLSSSIIGLDTVNGTIKWTFQFTPHDVWGWGCTGNIAMVPATIGGVSEQVLAKECGNGYLYLLNPKTGALLYSGQLPGVTRVSGAQIPNIMNQTAMQESLAQVSGASPKAQPVYLPWVNIAYDPSDGLLLGAVGDGSGQLGSEAPLPTTWNSTAFAFDLTSPHLEWSQPVPNVDFSYISIADGVAYMADYEGDILVATTQTGSQIWDIHAAMAVTSLFVEAGVHGQSALVVAGYTIATKQQIQSYTYTPAGLSIVPPST